MDRGDAVTVPAPDLCYGIWYVYHAAWHTQNQYPDNAARVEDTNSSPARPTGGYGTDTIIVHVILDSTPTGSRIIRKAISGKLVQIALALNHTMGNQQTVQSRGSFLRRGTVWHNNRCSHKSHLAWQCLQRRWPRMADIMQADFKCS